MKCNESNFIKRLKKQKEDALEYIIEEYSSLVHAICYKILSNIGNDAIDECVNDVFLTVWQKAHQYKGQPEDFKKWIGTVTKYKAIDRFRQLERQRSREQSDEYLHERPDSKDIEMQLVKKEEKNQVLVAISSLPAVDREIFMMKYFLQLSTVEIAESLNISTSAVENRLYRGKKKLAQNKQLKERFL